MPGNPRKSWRNPIPLMIGSLVLSAETCCSPVAEARWVYLFVMAAWIVISLFMLGKSDQNDKRPVAPALQALDAGVGVILLAGGLFMTLGFFSAAASIVGLLEKCSPLLAAWWTVVYARQIQRPIIYLSLIFIGIIPTSAHLEGWVAIQFILLVLLEVAAIRYALAVLQAETAGLAILDRGAGKTLDPVTGFALPETFEAELALVSTLADRQGATFSLLACEIDGYAAYVDQFGAGASDRLLRQVAVAIGDCLRISDTVGRWDGSRIMAILPATAAEGAWQVAEKMRRRAAAIAAADRGPVTLRFAVTEHRAGDDPLVAVEQVETMLSPGSRAAIFPA
jgi:diguanylate cyclase (GGDEF)-like protein